MKERWPPAAFTQALPVSETSTITPRWHPEWVKPRRNDLGERAKWREFSRREDCRALHVEKGPRVEVRREHRGAEEARPRGLERNAREGRGLKAWYRAWLGRGLRRRRPRGHLRGYVPGRHFNLVKGHDGPIQVRRALAAGLVKLPREKRVEGPHSCKRLAVSERGHDNDVRPASRG